jgi:uncharacterized membrane protein
MTGPSNSNAEPRGGLAASRGLHWWSSSITWLFGDVQQIGTWVLMALVYLLLSLLLHFIPLFGFVAAVPLNFVFSGGLLLAASRSARGETPAFADLFAGFGPRAGPLISAGALVLVACLAVFAAMLLVGVWAVISAIAGGILTTLTLPDPAAWGIGLGTAGVLFLCVLALIPISMAAWLAPALIMLRGIAPVDALRMSLAACQRNPGALTVYGLVGILFALVATLLLMLGWLVVVPMIFLSSYAAYQDIFAADLEVLG